MSLQTSTSFMPEKLRILSGSALKMLAMAIMLIDHTASFLLRHYPPAIAPWFQIGSTTYSLYRVMRDVGRAAFPIFCFLLVEGFLHTHNRQHGQIGDTMTWGVQLSLFSVSCLWKGFFTPTTALNTEEIF